MCGIAGFCVNKKDHLPRLSNLVDSMLLEIEARGQDSTGMAWVDRKRTMRLSKKAIPARSFVRAGKTRQINRTGAEACILHTRFATQGTVENNVNNHPIYHGPIIGVHNGHLNNDYAIFRELDVPRNGQVDSEAAFALLAHGQGDVTELLGQLQGNAALAWLDSREKGRTLHVARVNSSPLSVGQTKGGSFVFASTMPMLERGCADAEVELDWRMELDEGTYLKVRNGSIVSFERFAVAKPSYRFTGYSPTTDLGKWRANKGKADTKGTVFGEEGEWLDDDTFIPYSTPSHRCNETCDIYRDRGEAVWCLSADVEPTIP